VQPTSDGAGDLGQPALDRHVYVLVVGPEREHALQELPFDLVESPQQGVTIVGRDDLPVGEHRGVRTRLGEILRPQAPVEVDRRVQALEVGVLGLVEA